MCRVSYGQPHAYIVDDDQGFRDSLALLLRTADWKASTYASVTEFRDDLPRLQPGVVILDIRMPSIDGLDFLESLDLDLDKFSVIVVTGHGEVSAAVRSLKAGAVDFIEKPFCGEEFSKLIGGCHDRLLERRALLEQELVAKERISSLSTRETQVLAGLMAGAPHKVIAHDLGISVRTVEMYRGNVIRKLGVKTTTAAIQIGTLAGLAY